MALGPRHTYLRVAAATSVIVPHAQVLRIYCLYRPSVLIHPISVFATVDPQATLERGGGRFPARPGVARLQVLSTSSGYQVMTTEDSID